MTTNFLYKRKRIKGKNVAIEGHNGTFRAKFNAMKSCIARRNRL